MPLEAAGNGVLAQSFLVPAHFVQLGIAVENVPHDHGHLGDERPVLVRVYHLGLANDLRQVLTGVAVKALFAVGFNPAQRLVKLVMIVNAQGDPAHNLGHIYPLGTNAKVFLEHFRVAEAAGNTHGNATQVHIGLVLHPAYCSGSVGKAQDLLCHIGRDLFIRHILHIMAVNGKGGQPLLRVSSHDGGQVHSAGALRAVKAPNRLNGVGVHVKGLRSVAPAGGHRQGGNHILAGKIFGTLGCLCAAADGGGGEHALYRRAVRIAQIFFDQRFGCGGHAHGLSLQALTHAAPAAVNGGANTDFWISHRHYLRLRLAQYVLKVTVRPVSGCRGFGFIGF